MLSWFLKLLAESQPQRRWERGCGEEVKRVEVVGVG
jgi:hypothetical protein